MPRKRKWYRVETYLSPNRPRGHLVMATSQKAAIAEINSHPIVYDKRYWSLEIYAYSVNGEDF